MLTTSNNHLALTLQLDIFERIETYQCAPLSLWVFLRM
jgi:hypothetical protein